MTKHTSGTLLTKDNIQIHYDHYRNGHEKVVIIAHGFCCSKQALLLKDLAHEISDKYDVILFDFRGHGKSQGLFYWTAKEYMDLLATLEYARKCYSKIGVIGFSLGAATGIIAASKTNLIDSLISIAAPSKFWKIDYHLWGLDIETDILYNIFGKGKIGKGVRPGPFWERKEKPINLVNKINTPILYIHGSRDWIIKPWHSKALYDKTKAAKDLAVIKGGLHAEYLIRKNKEETVGLIKKWLKVTLVP